MPKPPTPAASALDLMVRASMVQGMAMVQGMTRMKRTKKSVRPWLLLGLLSAGVSLLGCDPGDDRETADLRCLGDNRPEGYSTVIRQCSVGSCSDSLFCNGFETCQGYEEGDSFICSCQVGTPPCNRSQFCDEENDECVGGCDEPLDEDKDGFRSIACGGDDCDDNDPDRYPGNTEVCDEDGVDEDCDPRTFGERDRDGDGHFDGDCFNLDEDGDATRGTDCDDRKVSVNPQQAEVCNGIDDNCDGDVDEELLVRLYPDEDGDGFGDGSARNVCPGTPNFAALDGDCDDDDVSVNPQQAEVCNGIDDDCDGDIDEELLVPMYRDEDGDGFGVGEAEELCSKMDNYALRAGDCDDSLATLFPDAMRCVTGGQGIEFEICQADGTWMASVCPLQASCIPQPDGTGVCH